MKRKGAETEVKDAGKNSLHLRGITLFEVAVSWRQRVELRGRPSRSKEAL
ncbi:hypothetical protein OAF42_00340 [Planctomicrobium sp.]|nr:hypothetical protein [Planctomicrobium sp.]MBT5020651.1 hypothetical protein [Planctomicrobium sp.]MDB4732866.1 hypothetical protein [Planctomicrobium sp.]